MSECNCIKKCIVCNKPINLDTVCSIKCVRKKGLQK